MRQSFLMIGQSNMAGRGFLTDVPPIYNEQIQMLRNGNWQMMTEPINYDRPVAGVSLASSFADAWCQEHDELIGLIPCAEGGSVLDDWQPDGVLFRHAISQARFAMETSQLAGILWHQGESDSTPEKASTYDEKLLSVIHAFRSELNAHDIPLIIGGLGDYLGKSGFGAGCTAYQHINDALQQFADKQANTYFVTAQELTANPDGIHLDALSQRRFGLRYFEAFRKKATILAPLEDEIEQLAQLANRTLTTNEQLYLATLDMAQGRITYPEFEARLASLYH